MKRKDWPWKRIRLAVIGLRVATRLLPMGEWLKAFNEWVKGLGPSGIVILIGV